MADAGEVGRDLEPGAAGSDNDDLHRSPSCACRGRRPTRFEDLLVERGDVLAGGARR